MNMGIYVKSVFTSYEDASCLAKYIRQFEHN
jgi:hypothetical protein